MPQPDQPWLTVAMPVHGGARWLPHTLDSLAAEPLDGIEIAILDSSPDDSCERIVATYSGRLPCSYERRPETPSWPAKTNLAVAAARGTYVAILHQDDLWLPGRVADMRQAIAAHPEAALLLNPSRIVDQHGRALGLWRCPLPAGFALEAAILAERLLVQNFVAVPAPVIRRDAWLAAGGMDETLWYTADWDLYLKLASVGTTVYREAATTAFRIHGGSLTVTGSAQSQDFARQLATVIDRHLHLAPDGRREAIRKRAMTSNRINCALAEAMAGKVASLPAALLSLLRLGPTGTVCYFRDSRIVERVAPRVRARLAGAF